MNFRTRICSLPFQGCMLEAWVFKSTTTCNFHYANASSLLPSFCISSLHLRSLRAGTENFKLLPPYCPFTVTSVTHTLTELLLSLCIFIQVSPFSNSFKYGPSSTRSCFAFFALSACLSTKIIDFLGHNLNIINCVQFIYQKAERGKRSCRNPNQEVNKSRRKEYKVHFSFSAHKGPEVK